MKILSVRIEYNLFELPPGKLYKWLPLCPNMLKLIYSIGPYPKFPQNHIIIPVVLLCRLNLKFTQFEEFTLSFGFSDCGRTDLYSAFLACVDW